MRGMTVHLRMCQRLLVEEMTTLVEPVCEKNFAAAVRFLAGWVSDDEADARQHLADHGGDDGAAWPQSRGSGWSALPRSCGCPITRVSLSASVTV
jgi:hypothetical protein